jgi:hypothetical protein
VPTADNATIALETVPIAPVTLAVDPSHHSWNDYTTLGKCIDQNHNDHDISRTDLIVIAQGLAIENQINIEEPLIDTVLDQIPDLPVPTISVQVVPDHSPGAIVLNESTSRNTVWILLETDSSPTVYQKPLSTQEPIIP